MTAAAQGTQVAQLITGTLAGSNMVDMRRLNRYGNMTVNALEAIALQNCDACLLPYLAWLSSFGHCESLAVLNRPALYRSMPRYPRLRSAPPCYSVLRRTWLFNYLKRRNFKPAHADFAPAADAAQSPAINDRCFHLVTADDGLIPHDREFARPTRRAGDAVTNIASFRAWIDHAAHVEIHRRFRVSRWRFDGNNVESLSIRESRPVAIDQDDRIDDLQRSDHVRLNRSASALRVPRAFTDDGEGIGCVNEQLTFFCDADGLAKFLGIIPRHSRTLLLFERKCIRPEFVMKHRLDADNTNLRGKNVAQARPNISTPCQSSPCFAPQFRSARS